MSGPQQTEILQIWQKKETEKKKLTSTQSLCTIVLRSKTVVHTFLFHRSTMQMAVSIKIQKFCYHGKGLCNNYQEEGLRNELQRGNYYVVSPRWRKQN